MANLSGAGRRDAYEKVKQYCSLRLEGNLGEEQIATELGFGSPAAMYMQLKNWGLSGPLLDSGRTEDATEKRRKASSSGDMEELPLADQAKPFFRTDLRLLTYYLNEISDLKEHRQGELFVSSSWVGEDWEHYHRSEYTRERWQKLCEDFDVDPSQEEFRIPISPYLHHGAGPTPWEGLVCLITIHALIWDSVDLLLDALHPRPLEVDREKLYARKGQDGATTDGTVTTLKKAAVLLAKKIRGVEPRTGTIHGNILDFEMLIALTVRELASEGYSSKEIYRELKQQRLLDEEGKFWVQPGYGVARKEKYTLDDVKRHVELGLLPPD